MKPGRSALFNFCGALCGVLAASYLGNACGTEGRVEPLHRELWEGHRLSREEVVARERQLGENPADQMARAGLLGYYWHHRPIEQDAHAEHVLWFIENAPESPALMVPWASISAGQNPDGYGRAKVAWLAQIGREPTNTTLLERASDYLSGGDTPLARELLERGEAIDPRNPHWARRLGALHWGEAGRSDDGWDPGEAARALANFERAYELADTEGRGYLLTDLGKAALAAGDLDKARRYAEWMLEDLPRTWDSDAWDAGNRLHYANLILGLIALADNDLEEAGARLIAAGQTPGSPQLNSFGPDMTLAKALLERGQRQTVLQYLELCLDFWKSGEEDLRDWMGLIEAGRTPDFDCSCFF